MNLDGLPLLTLNAEANAAVVGDCLDDGGARHGASEIDGRVDARIVRLETHVGAALVLPD